MSYLSLSEELFKELQELETTKPRFTKLHGFLWHCAVKDCVGLSFNQRAAFETCKQAVRARIHTLQRTLGLEPNLNQA